MADELREKKKKDYEARNPREKKIKLQAFEEALKFHKLGGKPDKQESLIDTALK